MKKIFLILVLFSLVICPNVFALETIPTSDNITYEKEFMGKENGDYLFNLTYTINSVKEKISINPDLFTSLSEEFNEKFSYVMPGDTIKYYITIINNSDVPYYYDENSFIASPNNDSYEKLTSNILYNGDAITTLNTYNRVFNKALVSLLKDNDISDENIDNLLKEKGYQGINELDKYYLDYYNNLYSKNNNDLEDFSVNEIKEILRSSKKPKINVVETNPNLLKLHFNFFYKHLLSLGIENDYLDDNNTSEFAFSRYYLEDDFADDKIKEKLNVLEKGTTKTLNLTVHFNGKDMENAYANYKFFALTHLSFTAKKGNLIVMYEDNDGNKLIKDINQSDYIGNNYKTEEKTFSNYKLIDVEGKKEGKYEEKDIIVKYIYEKKTPAIVETINEDEDMKVPYTKVEEHKKIKISNILIKIIQQILIQII